MLAFLLLLPTGLAADATLFLKVSPSTHIEVLPTHGPEWFEIAVLDNRVNLREQMPRSLRHVKNLETVSVGAGTTYVRIEAERDDLELTASVDTQGLSLRLSPTTTVREVIAPFEPAPYEVLVGNSPPLRRMKAPAMLPIYPLLGDATTYRQEGEEIPLGVVTWTGEGEEMLPVELQVPPTSWYAADGYRAILIAPADREEKRVAQLLLAETYLNRGIPHEAVYYLDKVLGGEGPWEPSLPHLQMARAQMGKGDYEAANKQCRVAAAKGGDPLTVLRCLGAIALRTGSPAPRHLALAIEQRAEDGDSLLLAAELMLADLDYEAAHRIAEQAVPELKGRRLGRAQMIVGDSSYFLGKTEESLNAWTVAARYGFSSLVRIRRVMNELSTAPRRTWSKRVPYLERLARSGGEEGMEANYLLGQIAEYFPDPESAARHYHAVWDRSATTAFRSDIPERLMTLCDRYARHLEEEERWADLVIFTGVCWRSDLDVIAADTELSESWARGYVQLGLIGEALRVQRRVVRVRNELEREEVGPLVLLASLYTRSGRPREALETVAYVRGRLKLPAREDPRLMLREAEAHAAMGNHAEARRVWTASLRSEVVRESATRALGLLDAYEGKCASAVLRLTTADESQRLARSRCALELGREAEAEREAATVVVNGHAAFEDEGTWLLGAAAFAQRRPETVLEAEGSSALWAAVLAEEAEATAFDAMLDGR